MPRPAVSAGSLPKRLQSAQDSGAFGRPFWYTYGANSCMMVAISLLFRYGDFIKLLGGTELELGWIVCAGMVGSLAMRLAQGVGIDTYGPRQVWLWSSTAFVLSCAGHLLVTHVHGPLVFALRILFQTSIAGFFGASITYISGRAPTARMAEVIGTLGTSGFVGMILGTSLGDWLLHGVRPTRTGVDRMFLAATALAAIAFVLSWLATRGHEPRLKRRSASVWNVLRRYHPGWVLMVGVAMGVGLGLPGVFLSRYAASLDIANIGMFFGVYAPTAFVTRLSIRRLPEKLGIRRMILVGMAAVVLGMFSFLLVRVSWHLILPAVFIGVAHACLFPAVIAGGSGPFPSRYRGLGTTLMLATFDLGSLVGSPAVGEILHWSGYYGLPPYPTMFVCVGTGLAAIGGLYAWQTTRERKPGPRRAVRPTPYVNVPAGDRAKKGESPCPAEADACRPAAQPLGLRRANGRCQPAAPLNRDAAP